MDEEKFNKILNDTFNEVRKTLFETSKPTEYIDTKKMSKREKDELIKDLQDKNHRLQTELIITKSVNDRIMYKNNQVILLRDSWFLQ